MYLCLNKLASKYGKGIALVFLIYTVQSSKNTRVILFLFINFIAVFPFSFVSYATNLLHLFFNQVCFEKKKKKKKLLTCWCFFQLNDLFAPYICKYTH